jgi:hypothetical protein
MFVGGSIKRIFSSHGYFLVSELIRSTGGRGALMGLIMTDAMRYTLGAKVRREVNNRFFCTT